MGCTKSKEANTIKNIKESDKQDRAIDSEFQEINIARFDEFFSEASDLLTAVEDIRSGIEDSKEEGISLSGTWQLQDPKFFDIVQVLFWAASAENEGQIKKTDLEIINEAPFIQMNSSKIYNDTYKLYETFSTYIKTLIEAPEKLQEIIDKLQSLSDKAPELVKEGKGDIQNSDLGFTDKAKAVIKLGKNAAKLPKELIKCKNLLETVTTAKNDMKEMIPKLKDLVMKADEVGSKAYEERMLTPSEIFEKYHLGLKKTPQEIEEEKKKRAEEQN